MDIFKEVQNLAAIAEETLQEGTKNCLASVEEAKTAVVNLSTEAGEALEQWTVASLDLVQQSSATLNETINSVKTSATEFATSSAVQAETLKQESTQAVRYGLEAIGETFDNAKHAIFELGVTGSLLASALENLPKTAEELAKEMPKIAARLRNGAGLRQGDAPRSDAEVMKLFAKIPGTSKLGASETKIWEFLNGKDGSHIIPRHKGGSNNADNILWEIHTDNLRRGARTMTGGEQIYIRFYNAVDSLVKNSGTIAKLGIATTGTAIITQAVITAASYALDLYRGEMTLEAFKERMIETAVSAGINASIFFLVFVATLALFPELALLLSAPVVVAGFNALFGISIAVPIIQSLIRHIEAGGFGEEIAEGYQNLVAEA